MRFIWVILVDTIFYRLYVNYIAFIGSRSFVSDWVFHSCHISFRFAIRIYLLYCLYIILIYPEICKIVSFDQVCRLYANSFQRQSYSIFIHFVPFNFNIVRICTLNVFISFFEVRKEIKYSFFFSYSSWTTLLKPCHLPQFSSSFHRPYVDGKYRFVM